MRAAEMKTCSTRRLIDGTWVFSLCRQNTQLSGLQQIHRVAGKMRAGGGRNQEFIFTQRHGRAAKNGSYRQRNCSTAGRCKAHEVQGSRPPGGPAALLSRPGSSRARGPQGRKWWSEVQTSGGTVSLHGTAFMQTANGILS